MKSQFFWYELATTDTAAATAFYTAVVGWEADEMGGPHSGYTIVSAEGMGVGGIAPMPPGLPPQADFPRWSGYILVDDCDAAVARLEAAGATIRRAPDDIPEVGRFAVIGDPGGAGFNILQPLPRPDAKPPRHRMAPGNVGWHELYAHDGDAAYSFYAEQFGWTETSAMDMGSMGTYRLWAPEGEAEAVGGMMTKPPHMERPAWLFYFVVDSVNAAAERVTANGGTVLNGPMPVPDGSFIVQASDPQGAMFALVSKVP